MVGLTSLTHGQAMTQRADKSVLPGTEQPDMMYQQAGYTQQSGVGINKKKEKSISEVTIVTDVKKRV